MRFKFLTLVATLAVVVAACGGDSAADTTTTTAPTTTTTDPVPEATLLSYTLEPGTTLSYEVNIDQTIVMQSSGDATAMDEEDFPGAMDIRVVGTTLMEHAISDGPEPDTYEIHITGEFQDLEVTGTVDGESVEESDIADLDLANIDPIDVTIVVDEQGNVVPQEGGLGDDLFGDLGGLGGLGALGQFGATGPGQFFGVPLADREVTVGDSWSKSIETPTIPGLDPISVEILSEVIGTDEFEGTPVLVIDTTTTTSEIDIDLAEFLIGFMTAFLPEDPSDEEQAELDSLIEDLRFAITAEESEADATTLFDSASGVVQRTESQSAGAFAFDLNVPDEETGEMVAFALDVDVAQNMTYTLVDSSNA